MIIQENTTLGNNAIIINTKTGIVYSYIKQFDTKTKEAIVFVFVDQEPLKDSKHQDIYDTLRTRYNFNPELEYKVKDCQIGTYDKNRTGGGIILKFKNPKLNPDNVVVTARVTLYGAVAINKKTLEEIK